MAKREEYNLNLIDRPETIAGLEKFDIVMVAIAIFLPASIVTALVGILFFGLYPLFVIAGAIWLREKKRGKHFGYFQREIYWVLKKVKGTKEVFYIKS
jgi:hypothetical protein